MMVSAVFDIGKTNKKFFLFDENHQQVYREYAQFDPLTDEDGDECENLPAIEAWVKKVFKKTVHHEEYQIQSLNFSSYGASMVHVGTKGRPVTPFYNYLKPVPPKVTEVFYEKYGGQLLLCRETASPALGFLNSGLQLYWLKYQRPDAFTKIKWSLHLPQYLSYLFTGKPVSDFTSIGCHTALWDFENNDYHPWVYQEDLDQLLAPVVSTDSSTLMEFGQKKVAVGVGIHDSSAALLPYLWADRHPFILVSTGTWSITINAFNDLPLTDEELNHDCLNFLGINGNQIRACRLFLGKEYNAQMKHLHRYFEKEYGYHRKVHFDKTLYIRLKSDPKPRFNFEHITINRDQPASTDLDGLASFSIALHKLIIELVELQVQCIQRVTGHTKVNKLYIDGGFANNDLFTNMLALSLPKYKIRTTQSPLGSALGAALVLAPPEVTKNFLDQNYAMKKLSQ